MSGKRYTDEFKIEAVRQVTDRGYSVVDVAERLGVTTHSLYAWLKKFGPKASDKQELDDAQQELRRLKADLRRVTEERDIKFDSLTFAQALEEQGLSGLEGLGMVMTNEARLSRKQQQEEARAARQASRAKRQEKAEEASLAYGMTTKDKMERKKREEKMGEKSRQKRVHSS